MLNNPLTVLSLSTLKLIKEDLIGYVKDLSKDIQDSDVRIAISGCLRDLDNIDKAIEELQPPKQPTT